MTNPRRSRAEWDAFARTPAHRRHRVLGQVGLAAAGVAAVTFALASVAVPGRLGWAIAVALVAAAATGAVLLRRVQRAASGWSGRGAAQRWVDEPHRRRRR